MSDIQKMQADGGGQEAGRGKEQDGQMASGGQSAGGAYPNDAPKGEQSGPMGHGGQAIIAHHGGGELGDEPVEGGEAEERSGQAAE